MGIVTLLMGGTNNADSVRLLIGKQVSCIMANNYLNDIHYYALPNGYNSIACHHDYSKS